MGKNVTIDQIQLKMSEQQRLLDTLKYYGWLEEHGLSWDVIKGVRKCPNNTTCGQINGSTWLKIAPEVRKRYRFRAVKTLIDYKLTDGTTVILPYPPFHDDVIYNRSRLEGSND